MKDKNSIPKSPSGIIIADNISLSLPKKKSFLDYIPLIFIAFLGCFGTVNSFVSMFHIDISYLSVNFYTFFFFFLFSAVFCNPKSISVPAIPIFLVYEFMLYRKWNSYLNGFMLTANQVYNVIYPERGEYFRIDLTEVVPEADIKLFFIFSIFLFTAIICCLSIVWPDFYFGFIFTFPFLEIGLYHGKTPHLIPAFILIIYWTSLLTVHHSGYYRSTKRNKTGFIRKYNSFFSKPTIKCHSAGQSGVIMAVLSAAVIALSFAVINISGYSRSKKINTMRSNVKTAVSEFTVDDIGGSLERLSASFGLTSMKQYSHRLGNFDSISYKGKTDLVVTSDRYSIPDGNIYLKGYVGSVYDGRSWGTLDKGIYEKAEDIFEPGHPQNMLYSTFGRNMMDEYSQSNINMTVKPSVFNQKYLFTPYNSLVNLPADKIKYINDTIIDTDEKKKYSFEVSQFQEFSSVLNKQIGDYDADDKYGGFVRSNYLDVPNNDDTIKLYNTFIKNSSYNNVWEQLENIKKILSENAKYTLSPGKTPAGKDFVSYFLLENHKGYCVHFATAGIMLARMSGIPARYADGYVVLRSDFNMDNYSEGQYRIEIQDKRAHAWAEIYISGYGWVPYEFTPASAAALDQYSNPETTAVTTKRTSSTVSSVRTTVSTAGISSTSFKKTPGNNSSADSGKNRAANIISGMPPEAKLLISGTLIILITVCVILAVHVIVTKRREKSFSTDSCSANAINAYEYIIKILEFCDIKNNNMQYLEFAEFAELSEKRVFGPGTFSEITEIVLEAGMSGHEITREKSGRVIIFSQKTALSIYKKENAFRKLYMKYIKNLL